MRIEGVEPLLPFDVEALLLERLTLPGPLAWDSDPWERDPLPLSLGSSPEPAPPILICGYPAMVVIGIGCDSVLVAPARVVWAAGTHDPRVVLRQPAAVPVNWERPLGEATVTEIQRLVDAAIKRRRRSFVKCTECGKRLPPEWMMDAQFAPQGRVCQGCAERNHGVVH